MLYQVSYWGSGGFFFAVTYPFNTSFIIALFIQTLFIHILYNNQHLCQAAANSHGLVKMSNNLYRHGHIFACFFNNFPFMGWWQSLCGSKTPHCCKLSSIQSFFRDCQITALSLFLAIKAKKKSWVFTEHADTYTHTHIRAHVCAHSSVWGKRNLLLNLLSFSFVSHVLHVM